MEMKKSTVIRIRQLHIFRHRNKNGTKLQWPQFITCLKNILFSLVLFFIFGVKLVVKT